MNFKEKTRKNFVFLEAISREFQPNFLEALKFLGNSYISTFVMTK